MEPSLAHISVPEFVRPADILQALKQDALFAHEAHAIWQCSQEKERSEHRLSEQGFSQYRCGRYSVIGVAPRKSLVFENNRLTVTCRDGSRTETTLSELDDPFAQIEIEFPFIRTPAVSPSKLPFSGGLLGFVSYDTGRYFERIAHASGRAGEPDIFLAEYDTFVIYDAARSEAIVVTYAETAQTEHSKRIERLLRELKPAALKPSPAADAEWTARFSRVEFAEIVNRALEYIRAGDIFQVVLANTFSSKRTVDPLAVFARLEKMNPSPYHFLIRFGERTLVGASPETMLRGAHRESAASVVRMRLVAGTYPKGSGDRAFEQAERLGTDNKELAEHLMLVDHARNDIGRVAEIGSVEVSDLFSVEAYSDVHHLVSQVSGRLKPGEGLLSALRSCFPIATLTGTPKIRATEIIAELEGPSRGIFGGAVVAFGYDASIESAVAIRGLVTGPEGTRVQAGAGIVFDSNPEREYEECHWKAKALLDAAAGCPLL